MSPLFLIPNTFLHFLFFRCRFSVTRLNSITARTMSSQSSQRIFQLRQDPLTGNSEWIVIEDNDQTLVDGLLATTSYLDMLNDSRRNQAYRLAIEKTITKPCHVLDIGAGTGLLSMMAARAMGEEEEEEESGDSKGIVTACKSYLPMVKLMRKVLHKNRMTKNINLINKRSDELRVGLDIATRADVFLVESTFLCNMHDLRNNEAKTSDGVRLVPPGLDSVFGIKSQQYSMHVDAIEKEIKLSLSKYLNLTFGNGQKVMESLKCT